MAGGLWVRCGCTRGRSLLALAGAYVLRVLPRAKSLLVGAGFICNVSLARMSRTSAKFGACMLLIYLRLQNDLLPGLLQHGKLFACGTLEVQIRK
jgi:hypothetical protein